MADELYVKEPYDVYGDEGTIIDWMADEGLIHCIIESYLEADEGLENREEECVHLFDAMFNSEKLYWMAYVRGWIKVHEEWVRDGFNEYYRRHYDD